MIYTPTPIAQRIVSAAGSSLNGCIADFAAGDGGLLLEARSRWPEGKVVATDVDRRAIGCLLTRMPDALVGVCDFLRPAARRACKVLQVVKGQVSLVLLNPPFSCRGGHTVETPFFGVDVRCSTAMAFVLNGLTYLEPSGELVAVLPASSLTSKKDKAAREIVASRFGWEVLEHISKYAFRGYVASCCVVKMKDNYSAPLLDGENASRALTAGGNGSVASHIVPLLRSEVLVMRGCTQMHALKTRSGRRSLPVIHTTELRDGEVSMPHERLSNRAGRVLQGPAVLMPRVGRPDADKVCVWDGHAEVVLSDCVIALCCPSVVAARTLREVITASWPLFASLYGGTGAKYVILDDVIAWLEGAGVRVHRVRTPHRIPADPDASARQDHVEGYLKARDVPPSPLGHRASFQRLT